MHKTFDQLTSENNERVFSVILLLYPVPIEQQLRSQGLRAMWRGLLPRLMRIPPGQAIVWAVSDQITGYCEKNEIGVTRKAAVNVEAVKLS